MIDVALDSSGISLMPRSKLQARQKPRGQFFGGRQVVIQSGSHWGLFLALGQVGGRQRAAPRGPFARNHGQWRPRAGASGHSVKPARAFVAHFQDYDHLFANALKRGGILPESSGFHPANSPTLSPEFDQLVVELVTLPFSEQNESGTPPDEHRPGPLPRENGGVSGRGGHAPAIVEEVQVNPVRSALPI